jgi:hypothetical protein
VSAERRGFCHGAQIFSEKVMKNSVLIISSANDCHVHAVTQHLEAAGIKASFFIPDQLLDVPLTLYPVEGAGKLQLDLGGIDLDQIGAIWFRKPEPIDVSRFGASLSGDELDFVQAEAQEVAEGLYAMLSDRFWLVKPPYNRLPGRKLRQLQIAREVGFEVPRSLVTNDVQVARAFAESLDWDLAIKSLSWASVAREDGDAVLQYGVYCRRLTPAEAQAGIDNVRHAPAILQEYIGKRSDLRVIALGRHTQFAVEIQSQNDTFASEDCRFRIRDLEHKLVEIPELREKIWQYMDRQDLQYAAFDFAISKQTGEPVFLEANVNGQFLWLERETGAPISRAVAKTLAEACEST